MNRVYLFGIRRFEESLPRLLRSPELEVQTSHPGECDLLYVVYGTHLLSRRGLWLWLQFLVRGKPLVVHWIGSDVLDYCDPRRKRESGPKAWVRALLRRLMRSARLKHLVCAEHLREELSQAGITDTVFAPMPTELVRYNVSALPATPAVLTYTPEARSDFYGLPKVMALAEANSDIVFHVVGHSGIGVEAPGNVRFHGWVGEEDMDKLYRACSCVLRLVDHDALGGTVLEGVARGRYAVWSYPAPYAYCAKSVPDAQTALNDVLTKTTPNEVGARMVAALYDRDKLVVELQQILLSAVKQAN